MESALSGRVEGRGQLKLTFSICFLKHLELALPPKGVEKVEF